MSKYGWERGEIQLSVKEFGSVRRDMIAFHNQHSADLYVQAQSLYTTLKTAGKGKRGFDFHSAYTALTTRISEAASGEIFDAIFPNEKVEKLVAGQIIPSYERSEKPKAPKRSQFNPLKTNAMSIPVGYEAGITFDKKRRVVIWNVADNNHSVERAHEHGTGREFFNRLSRVVWTRGTGGEIVGNDEYNQESQSSGMGGNYVTHRFGIAEKQFKASFGRR